MSRALKVFSIYMQQIEGDTRSVHGNRPRSAALNNAELERRQMQRA